METKLARIAELAKEKPKEQFTSLYHLLNKEMLLECHVWPSYIGSNLLLFSTFYGKFIGYSQLRMD